jgi:glycosyltransferase involved in cell wall biosynthesis
MTTKISIIIPLYNSEKTIKECIQSIIISDFNQKFEIIVVDDGSTDESIDIVSELDVILIKQENKGASAARNKGASIAKSDFIVFVDSDIVFFKDTLGKMYDHLKNGGVDFISGRYSKKAFNNKWVHKYKALADYYYLYGFLYLNPQKNRLFKGKPGVFKDVVFSGGLEAYKKRVFEKLGGFDESIKGAGIEREILITKLVKNYLMVADGNIKTKHHFPDFNDLIRNYFFRTMHSAILMKDYTRNFPYLKKNMLRVLLGSLTTISFLIAVFLYIIFNKIILFAFPVILFTLYFSYHKKMFISSFKDYSPLFGLYTITMNLFCCLVISLAGFLGAIYVLFKDDKKLQHS